MKSSNLFGLFVFCFSVVHSWDQPASYLEHETVTKFRPQGRGRRGSLRSFRTEQIDWRAKQSLQVAFVSDDLIGHGAKDIIIITPSIAWRRKA